MTQGDETNEDIFCVDLGRLSKSKIVNRYASPDSRLRLVISNTLSNPLKAARATETELWIISIEI